MLGAVGLTPYFAIVDVGQGQSRPNHADERGRGCSGVDWWTNRQIGWGSKLVGIAGTDEKCQWVVDELGFDDCINYRTTDDMEAAIREKCPEGGRLLF